MIFLKCKYKVEYNSKNLLDFEIYQSKKDSDIGYSDPVILMGKVID
jgi:hypothetical protein